MRYEVLVIRNGDQIKFCTKTSDFPSRLNGIHVFFTIAIAIVCHKGLLRKFMINKNRFYTSRRKNRLHTIKMNVIYISEGKGYLLTYR